MILLDGTSSSGKSTIAELFKTLDYYHIANDHYSQVMVNHIVYNNIKNEYVDMPTVRRIEQAKLMVDESKKHNKVIFDSIYQLITKFIDRDKLFIIIVYAPLNDLIRNIISRQMTSPRGLFVFNQYSKKYVKTDDISKSIDTVNRQKFVEILKTMKYEFKSENDLVDFANKIFKELGIEDDNDHHIKLRDEFAYDYILNTTNKSKEEIFAELKQQIQ